MIRSCSSCSRTGRTRIGLTNPSGWMVQKATQYYNNLPFTLCRFSRVIPCSCLSEDLFSMRTTAVSLFVAIAVLLNTASAEQPPGQAAGVPPNIAAILADIRKADTGQLAVSEEDGRFLRLLIA